jgi:hypothetical protein
MPTYSGYGLTIQSDIALSAFPPGEGRPDVLVTSGTVKRHPGEEPREIGYTYAGPDRYYLAHDTVGCIEVAGGRYITLDLLPDAPEDVVQTLVANLACGVLLHQRQVITLHASAVAVEGQVVAFIGDKGWGKSTMASALYRRGHRVITDDVLGIDVTPQGPALARPGVPQLKLWPDSVSGVLGEPPKELERVHEQSEKRVRSFSPPTSPLPKPLASIYVLGGGREVRIENLSPRAAFRYLLPHAYTRRILQDTRASDWHLKQLTQLLSHVSVSRLLRPQDLSLLPEVADRIEGEIPLQPSRGSDE